MIVDSIGKVSSSVAQRIDSTSLIGQVKDLIVIRREHFFRRLRTSLRYESNQEQDILQSIRLCDDFLLLLP